MEARAAAEFTDLASGYAWVGGCMDIAGYPELQERKDAMHFTIGTDGIFSYSAGGPHLLTWLSIFTKQDPCSSNPRYLLERNGHWKDPVVQNIISKAEPGRVYDIMTVPKLPTWGEGGIVLVGDAAHAMSPTTGQGVSQNLEDAQTLALLLSVTTVRCYAEEQNGSLTSDAIDRSLLLYYHIRHERVERIAATGEALDKHMLNSKRPAVYVSYCLLWMLNKCPGICK
jgi:2-polyprenyl-6-methoxyphenol hydroxylase-like FAD-dependent oxidoreductase